MCEKDDIVAWNYNQIFYGTSIFHSLYVNMYVSDYVWLKSALLTPTYYYLLLLHIFSLPWNVKDVDTTYIRLVLFFSQALLPSCQFISYIFGVLQSHPDCRSHVHIGLSTLIPFKCIFFKKFIGRYLRKHSALSILFSNLRY